MKMVRIENVKELEKVFAASGIPSKKGTKFPASSGKDIGIMIGRVGEKKRKEIIAKANEMKIKILNKYKKVEVKK
jgi:ribosomal protein L32E